MIARVITADCTGMRELFSIISESEIVSIVHWCIHSLLRRSIAFPVLRAAIKRAVHTFKSNFHVQSFKPVYSWHLIFSILFTAQVDRPEPVPVCSRRPAHRHRGHPQLDSSLELIIGDGQLLTTYSFQLRKNMSLMLRCFDFRGVEAAVL